jgi:hypothetical protein
LHTKFSEKLGLEKIDLGCDTRGPLDLYKVNSGAKEFGGKIRYKAQAAVEA